MPSIDMPGIVLAYGCLLFSLCVHEAAHAIIADRCGDPSARLLGRATLNPLKHVDPIGTVVMPLMMIVWGIPFLFGWAKPVPFNPRNLANARRDPVLIAIAGPTSNLLVAFISAVLFKVILVISLRLGWAGGLPETLLLIAGAMLSVNLALAVFNLIPVPPLDGGHVLFYFLPPSGQRVLDQVGPFGILVAMMIASPIFRIVVPVFTRLFDWWIHWGL